MELYFQAAGWIGMAIILATYYLVTIGKWGTHTSIDEVANLIGSVLIAVNVYHYGAWPAFTLNVAWGAIALLNLTRKLAGPRENPS